MTKRRRAEKPRRELTKRQLSRWQQQKRRQRFIFIAGLIIILAVIVIVTVGWYNSSYQPLHQTAIRVNDTEFNMKYYVDMLKFRGGAQLAQNGQYLADFIASDIERSELVRQGALKLGISVSDDEVKEKLKSADLPVDDVHMDLMRTSLLTEKLLANYFDTQVPTSAEQRHVLVMLLESESQADEVRAGLSNGDNFTALAAELSLDPASKANKGDFGWHPKSILMEMPSTPAPMEYAFNAEAGVLSQPLYDDTVNKTVGYWLLKVTDRNADTQEAHVYAILLGSEPEALKVKARIEAGEDFAALAEELSQHTSKDNGGDLGTVGEGQLPPAVGKLVFNPEAELGTLSDPIRDDTVTTKGGFWLVKVLDKDDDRQIDQADRDTLKGRALNDWVSSLMVDSNNVIDDSYLDQAKKTWAVEQAMKN